MEKEPQLQPEKPSPPKTPVKLDSLFAAAGTGAGSLILYMFTQVMDMQHVVGDLQSTQNMLVNEEGLIRPSTSAIRSEIQLEELNIRLSRLEKFLVIHRDD